jgi:hypothetical protein
MLLFLHESSSIGDAPRFDQPFHHTGLGWKESKIKEILENFI